MKSRKLLFLYACLLVGVLASMGWLKHAYGNRQVSCRDYEAIAREGVLRMVTEYNQSGYYVAGDTVEGFQYELSRAIAQVSGLEVQVHLEMSLTESFKQLAGNECDIVARNIPVTTENKEEFLFTDPIVFNKQVLVQRTAQANGGREPIRNQLDLAHKTLYIPKDSPARLRLQNLEHEIGDTIFVKEDALYSSEQLAIMVAKGDIDYAVCDQRIAVLSARQLPEIDIDTDISFTQLQSWAVRKSAPVLRDSLNSWLRQIRKNGWYDAIYRRYYEKSR